MNKLHIVALSDTHGRLKHTYIPKCDVVTISGDFSALRSDRRVQKDGELCNWIVNKFIPWLVSMPCERVIITPGNHDFITEQEWFKPWFNEKLNTLDEYYLGSNKGIKPSEKIVYLCYSTYTYKGFTFYGCPASDIHGWAWSTDGDYTKYLVPEDIDVMLVHQAPDYLYMGTSHFTGYTRNFGSTILLDALRERPANLPDLLLCGHIHTGDHTPGVMDVRDGNNIYSCLMANVSSINEDYNEWFYARNFVLIREDDTTIIETWVSPAEGPNEVVHYNERETFMVGKTTPTQTN